MAQDNKEIEIKIPVSKESFLKVKEQLKNNFIKHSSQKDTYYTPSHRNFISEKYPFEWLSIRERGDKKILNYKHYYPERAETNTHCDEYETEINKEQITKILKALDFKELITIKKERSTYETGMYEIALDEVEELGYFIEIEAITHLDTVEKTRQALFDYARKLGLEKEEADKRGYPYLMLKKKAMI